MHACMYAYTELTIWYWVTNLCALPWEDYFSGPQHSLVAYSYMGSVEISPMGFLSTTRGSFSADG